MVKYFNNKILAIVLFSLRIPAIYFVILIYRLGASSLGQPSEASLFNTIYYYKFGYFFFCPFQIVECEYPGGESY
jgi:hypothetical protein